MTRTQALTLSALGVKWRLIPGGLLVWIGEISARVSGFDQARDFAADYWGSL